MRRPVEILDGDAVRRSFSAGLGFSREDRRENIRRVALRCQERNESQIIVVAALISPFAEDRAMAAQIIGEGRFREGYLSTTLTVCEAPAGNLPGDRPQIGVCPHPF
jgi:adenylylsulfate kinase